MTGSVVAHPSLSRGDYVRSATDLYCVEQLAGGRALLEDCYSGQLLDVPVSFLLQLSRVRRDVPAAA